MVRPIAIDLYCGLGGWAEGFLAEGYDVIGFDIERHDYGTGGYPGWLVLQDVRTLHGSQFKNAAAIVASPPCQAYSYMAMPWKRAKQRAKDYRSNMELYDHLNELFNICFRIQREACEAAGRYIPLIVENVRGAQTWVGRSAWNFGSYHLWGDVPALMPIPSRSRKVPGFRFDGNGGSFQSAAVKVAGQDWSRFSKTGEVSPHWRMEAVKNEEHERGVKGFTPNGEPLGKNTLGRAFFSTDPRRKAASALIAKIPFPLARHIAQVMKRQHEGDEMRAPVTRDARTEVVEKSL